MQHRDNAPTVSVIIPVFNKAEYTRRCLQAVSRDTSLPEYEIIVVDNGSTDETAGDLAAIKDPHLRVLTNQSNMGFVEACNQGAGIASGTYLVFLNNDTEVQPGWLSGLLRTVQSRPDCGAVGAKLIYPDGKLQEAGGIMFSDGNGWNFGNGEDPDDARFAREYEVDYCSGACLLVRKDLFDRLHGFDLRYAPAYYEEADLCFRLRAIGFATYYNPDVRVIHYESVTAGRDTSGGMKRYLPVNRLKFVARWQHELNGHTVHPAISGHAPSTAERRRLHPALLRPAAREKRALVFFPQNPWPGTTGAHQRCLSMVTSLRDLGYDVTLASTTLFGAYPWSRESVEQLDTRLGVRAVVYEGTNDDRGFMTMAEVNPREDRRWEKYTPPGLIAFFQGLYDVIQPDVTVVNYAYWSELLPGIHHVKGVHLVDTLDLVARNLRLRQHVEGKLGNTPYAPANVDPAMLVESVFDHVTGREGDAREYELYDRFDAAIAISGTDAEEIQTHVSRAMVAHLPMGMEPVALPNSYDASPVFVIGDNPFNIQGYLYFAARVLPLIREEIPDFTVDLVGEASGKVQPADGIRVRGRVDSLTALYEHAGFALCPLLGLTGMSIKIVEAMANGLAVVAMHAAARSSPIEHGVNGFIAHDAAEFAQYTVLLARDPVLRKTMGDAARTTIRERYSRSAFTSALGSLIDAVQMKRDTEGKAKRQYSLGIGLVEHFGDIVACEPVARYLRWKYPDARISWVVTAKYRELLQGNPHVDDVVTVSCLTDWIELKERRTFDETVDLHVQGRKCTSRDTVLMKNRGNLNVTPARYYEFGALLPAFCQGAGLPALEMQPRVYIPSSAVRDVDALQLPERFIAVHCLSNETQRDWQDWKWNELAARLLEDYGIAIVEVGAHSQLQESCGAHKNMYRNLCGSLSLLETAEVIRRAQAFVGVDSGPAHFANALNVFGVIILGRYRTFNSYMPYTGPFADGRNATVLFNHHGPASEIAVEDVERALVNRLGVKPRGGACDLQKTCGPTPEQEPARLIAFYLPQFHPIPENDLWWGKGFTEWTNVGKATPRFSGHYQPHVPGELGYYDLRLPEIRDAQADLARRYGIEGFCYWHYWFNGKLLLERPLEEVLTSGKPDYPFCVAWANEPWSRRWDGIEHDVLQEQAYGGAEDDRNHFEYLLPAFRDRRYITVDGKPMFLIYNPADLPDAEALVSRWRENAARANLPGLYVVAITAHDTARPTNWVEKGFDATLDFQPDWRQVDRAFNRTYWENLDQTDDDTWSPEVKAVEYQDAWPQFAVDEPGDHAIPCVVPSWDNTARRHNGVVLHNSSPHAYQLWLQLALERVAQRPREKRMVFINAWNEWAEGNHLEPDRKFGKAFLDSTRRALHTPLTQENRMQILLAMALAAFEKGDQKRSQALLDELKGMNDPTLDQPALREKLVQYQARTFNRSGVIVFRNNEAEKSIAYFRKAVELDGRMLMAWKNLGWISGFHGRWGEAREAYERVLQLNPGDLLAMERLGDVSVQLGNMHRAEELYRNVLRADEGKVRIWKKLDALASSRAGKEAAAEAPQHTVPARQLSVIIPLFNNLRYTKECVASLQRSTGIDYELILVDNGSTDGTREWGAALATTDIPCTIIHNEKNEGFPRAVNQGLRAASGKYLLVLNNDVVLPPETLKRMIECMESDPSIGIAGPMSNSVSGPQMISGVSYGSLEEMYDFASRLSQEHSAEAAPFPRVAFLCTLISRRVVDAIGGLDERFSPGNFEDDDYCLRSALAGYRTVILRGAFVHHYGSKSFLAQGKEQYLALLEKNAAIFEQKWGAVPERIWSNEIAPKKRNIRIPLLQDRVLEEFERARLLVEDGDYAMAMSSLLSVIDTMEPGLQNGPVDRLTVLDLLGNVALLMGDLEAARQHFESELTADPNSSRACAGLGDVLSRGGAPEAAKTMYEWAVKNDPTNSAAARGLETVNTQLGFPSGHSSLAACEVTATNDAGRLLAEAERLVGEQKFNEALQLLEEAERGFNGELSSPEQSGFASSFFALRGFIQLSINEVIMAEKSFEKALSLDPQSAQACLGLGEVFLASGRTNDAKTMLEWAVTNDPSREQTRARLEEVNTVLGLPKDHNSLLASQESHVSEEASDKTTGAGDITAVNMTSAFARALGMIIEKFRPKRIVETGTYIGMGTTSIIASALRDYGITDATFYTIEVNPEIHRIAKHNLQVTRLEEYVRPLNGLSVPRRLLPSPDEIRVETVENWNDGAILVDHESGVRVQKYFEETDHPEVADDLLGQCLEEFGYQPDLVLLDSGGHMGNIEFNYLLSLLRSDCFIALDDVYHVKHHKSLQQIKHDPRFEVLIEAREKAGFCIARFRPA